MSKGGNIRKLLVDCTEYRTQLTSPFRFDLGSNGCVRVCDWWPRIGVLLFKRSGGAHTSCDFVTRACVLVTANINTHDTDTLCTPCANGKIVITEQTWLVSVLLSLRYCFEGCFLLTEEIKKNREN